ncbi:hypothetical protein BD310DRAFT_194074 [Dichomitus squalens]|uniref:Uncharacterized protein n=1 Tax=Dichomitus squalens TaxID=114155 RepID=A0A4Q9Q2E9_9APHY|nr:hypothetical protein BD310DRAFT_194074 [Dichomitus squalens]
MKAYVVVARPVRSRQVVCSFSLLTLSGNVKFCASLPALSDRGLERKVASVAGSVSGEPECLCTARSRLWWSVLTWKLMRSRGQDRWNRKTCLAWSL